MRANVCSGTASGKTLLFDMLSEHRGVVRLALHVQPGARRTGIVGVHGDALKVAVSAPPLDGRANEAICGVIAEAFNLSAKQVRVVAGAASRRKLVSLDDVSLEAATQQLATILLIA